MIVWTPRRHDWPERLSAFLAARQHAPFAWRSNDCFSFAMDAVLAMTGADPMAATRHIYSDALSAARANRARSITQRVADHFAQIPCGLARRGDLAIALSEGRACLMVMEDETLAGPGLLGLARLPRRLALAAFRVG